MANINLVVKKSSREVSINRSFAGVQMENLQDKFIVSFSDEFVNGLASMEYEVNGEAYYVDMTQDEETYILDIEQILISEEGTYPFQIRISNNDKVFKTKIFYLKVYPSLNAQEFPPSYTSWKDWVIDYVDENGGKINEIRQNGNPLPIIEKSVNIETPEMKNSNSSSSKDGYSAAYINGLFENLRIGTDKLQDESVTNQKIVNETISETKLNSELQYKINHAGVSNYDLLNNKPIYNQTSTESQVAFVNNSIITNGTKIYFNPNSDWDTFLRGLNYEQEYVYLVDGSHNFIIACCDLTLLENTGYAIYITDYTHRDNPVFVYATNSGSYEDISWDAGFNEVDLDNGIYTLVLNENETININSEVEGWNGLLISKLEIVYNPQPIEGNYYKQPDGNIYKYISGNYKRVLTQNDIDNEITQDSNNAVKSGAVYTALENKQNNLSFDNTPTSGSNNPVTSDGIYNALGNKQDTLTFDDTPTQNSNNPVKSGGVYNTLADKYTLIDLGEVSSITSETIIADSEIWSSLWDESKNIVLKVYTETGYGANPTNTYYFTKNYKYSDSDSAHVDYICIVKENNKENILCISAYRGDSPNLYLKEYHLDGSNLSSGSATQGQVLTADGNGGAGWQNASGGTTLNRYTAKGNALLLAKILFNAKSIISILNKTYSLTFSVGFRDDSNMNIHLYGGGDSGSNIYIAGLTIVVYGTRTAPTQTNVDNARLVTINSSGQVSASTYSPSANDWCVEYWNDTEIT